MRISLRLTLSLILVVSFVASLSAYLQYLSEEKRNAEEIARRSRLLANGLQPGVQPLLSKDSSGAIQKLISQFSNREHLAGVAIYDPALKVISITSLMNLPPTAFGAQLAQRSILSGAETEMDLKINGHELHAYAVPLRSQVGIVHVLVLFQDVTQAREENNQLFFSTIARILAETLLIVLITLLIIRWTIIRPLKETTDWMKRLRHGEQIDAKTLSSSDIFNPLTREVTTFARQLHTAKAAAEQEARLRQAADSLWTPERLKEHVRLKLGGRPLFVVSNREPYMHQHKGRPLDVLVPASGLVTALEPVMQACGGTWIAHGSTEADWTVLDANNCIAVPPDQPLYTLKRVKLTADEEQGYYYGFCNEGLWALCHLAHVQPVFRAYDWYAYQMANHKFAEAILDAIADQPEPCILIQDFHFALLPRLLKNARPDARIAIFWHIPWPNPEAFGICPWQNELLDGMLGADLIGFHTQYHCNNFLETADQNLECRADWEHFTIERQQHQTKVKPFPISVAYPSILEGFEDLTPPDKAAFLARKYDITCKYIGLGVERMDYTKGILQRFHAIERFFEKYPDFIGEFTFVQIGAPSRTSLKQYNDFFINMQIEAERINNRLKGTHGDWKPIVFLNRHHSQKEIIPLYKVCDVCMVTSLHDGMNLVAKEFVAAREDDDGVLILSQFTGAARELKDALIVNPYDIEKLSDAIYTAISMDPIERQGRMRNMRLAISENNIYRWASALIEELTRVRIKIPDPVHNGELHNA
jgi:trehalose-6-phosphate synthase